MGLSEYILLVAAASAVAIKLHTRHSFPRVGNQAPFGIGYLITAFQAFTKTSELIEEGLKKYPGKPFVLPTLGGSMLLTAHKGDIELMKRSDDSVWNQPIAINEGLQLDYVMNEFQQRTPYQAAVIRSDVTKAIGKFIPDVVEESQLSIQETFSPNGRAVTQIKVFDTMTHLIARISNRAMVGLPLCRNTGYLNAMVHFAECLVPYAEILRQVPRIARGVVYWMISSVGGGRKEEPMEFLIPYLKERLRDRHAHTNTLDINPEQAPTVADFLIDAAPPAELDDLRLLAMRVMNANFGAIHTSSIMGSHALFELACMSQSDIKQIRDEITTVLEEEGGWSKPALGRLWLLDSLLREVARVYGLGLSAFGRLTMKEGVLSDGTIVPPGWTVAVVSRTVHRDPSVYPNPDTFDPFRFSKLRMEADSDVKYGFTTLDKDYILFGVGRHACPGRFFASMELKIVLATILLNWDISLPDGVKERPKNMMIQVAMMPPPKAELVFTKRSA